MLIIPTGARTTLERPPVATYSIILTNTVIYLFCWVSGYRDEIIMNLGFKMEPFDELWFVRLFTGMFLHAGWLHLLGNVLYLWVFGATLEDRLGTFRYLLLYFLGGISGWMLYGFYSGTHPVVGASGCVSALLGAQVVINPLMEMRFRFIWLFPPISKSAHVWALIFVPAYFLLEWFSYMLNPSNVAHSAHLGGLLWGILFSLAVRLFLMPVREDKPKRPPLVQRNAGQTARTPEPVHADAAEAGRQAVSLALRQNNPTLAMERYSVFRRHFPSSILAPADQMQMGRILREKSDVKGAIETYQRLANSPLNVPFKADAAMILADIFEKDLRDYGRAHKTLSLVLRKFPDYERRDEVERRIHDIGDIIGKET